MGPQVSVIMPVYNAEAFLAEAVQSILDQTFRDLELIIVDDGSTDGSAAIVQRFTDPRIRYHRQENRGVAAALNTGLALAQAPLIARHDADDIADERRIAAQADYLAKHSEIGLLGTWAALIDAQGCAAGHLHHPTGNAAITYALIFDSALVHPSVMVRRAVLDAVGPYSEDPRIFEDHELWRRIARVARTANLPQELVRYRMLPVSASHNRGRVERLVEQRRRNLAQQVPGSSSEEIELLAWTGLRHSPIRFGPLRRVRRILNTIIEDIGGTAEEQAFMRADARMRLFDFHLVRGSSTLVRALDRLCKTFALALPG